GGGGGGYSCWVVGRRGGHARLPAKGLLGGNTLSLKLIPNITSGKPALSTTIPTRIQRGQQENEHNKVQGSTPSQIGIILVPRSRRRDRFRQVGNEGFDACGDAFTSIRSQRSG
ncbi:unnamed protein product, partial [Ectocarpus sp. 8 AP-2014]